MQGKPAHTERPEIPLEVQLGYARRELELCKEAEAEHPQLTRQQYAVMLEIKQAIIHTLERVIDTTWEDTDGTR